MIIETKISKKPVIYKKAIKILENRITSVLKNEKPELIWILEHNNVYTAGTSFKVSDIIDKSIKIIKTNRGGKITFHGKGQIIFYFVINLNSRKKDIRWFINIIEKSIIYSLKEFGINSYNDEKNIGIWIKHKSTTKKIAAIGIKIKKWVAYHGFAINYSVNLNNFKKIIPCGLKDKDLINISQLKDIDKNKFIKLLIKNFIKYLNNLS